MTFTKLQLENALQNHEFIFHYQPKVSMVTGQIIGAEALIRWQRKSGELLFPSDFIPFAESTGIISPITLYMLEELIKDIPQFTSLDKDFVVAINISAKSLDNLSFVKQLLHIFQQHQETMKHIEIELTESFFIRNETLAFTTFKNYLDEANISLVMDDFSSGYSSIDALSRFPFSTIKLDKDLILNMKHSTKNQIIVDSSVRMGHKLGLNIVAEGIEDEETYIRLQNAGCTMAQGFWISRPLDLEMFRLFYLKKHLYPASSSGILYMAQLDHVRWRKKVIDEAFFIYQNYSENLNIDVTNISDHTTCLLGKWYAQMQQGRCSQLVNFLALEPPHKKLHHLGYVLISEVHAGASKNRLFSLIEQINAQSALISTLLHQLELEMSS